jgi:hypothetical protein
MALTASRSAASHHRGEPSTRRSRRAPRGRNVCDSGRCAGPKSSFPARWSLYLCRAVSGKPEPTKPASIYVRRGIIAVLLFSQGSPGERFLRAVLGGARLPGHHRARHPSGRLAHRAHGRLQDYPDQSGPGLLRFGSWGHHAFSATFRGIPVSTTHTVTGSVVGVARPARSQWCAGISPATS